ncbi:MAG: hypothetical protein CL961_03335 [Euryarchaeota archaeon]|nr:hypothetical protein [Euryarchaeota archaeon]
MAAIISDKFRIFNAKQFLESLSEGPSETSDEKTRMYFFVGRPQRWDAYLEIFNANAVAFVPGNEVYVGANYASATFKATVREVYENSLLLYNIGPATNSTPGAPGASALKGWNGTADTGAESLTGVYRYATEDVPPVPLDNQTEKYDIYDDIIAAKRINEDFARSVIRRFNWDPSANPTFDMWKPDYSTTPGSGGQIGKAGATGATAIADAKYYLINSNYEVFKCLYNGQNPANPSGQVATNEPKTTPAGGQGTYANGIFKEDGAAPGKYIWKYMYTVPTDDVLRFLSTDFMPIVLPSNSSRQATEALATADPNAVDVVLVEDAGSGLTNGTYYAPIVGDGTGGKVEVVVAGGAVSSATVTASGSGYTYASVPLIDGLVSGDPEWTGAASGLYTDDTFATGANVVGANPAGALEVVLPPQGGHGANFEEELNAKRVMTNIRLTYAEGSGDFPVDNDFRRIGIIRDPLAPGGSTYATSDTLSGVYAVKLSGATADFQADETISQDLGAGNGTAYGTVVSWERDSGNAGPGGAGVLKYFQSPSIHTDAGVVRPFGSGILVNGATSLADGTIDATENGALVGVTFSSGFASPEIANNTGEIIYVENRRLITRAADQIEDIKLVIEF